MRVGGTTLSLGALVVSVALILPQAAAAIPANHVTVHYTVRAGVGEHRVIVVDPNGAILDIYSNTNNDIAPTAVLATEDGPSTAVTPAIQARYNSLMGQLKDNHIAIITRADASLATIDPTVIRTTTTDLFDVTPTHVAADPDPSPYQVALTQ